MTGLKLEKTFATAPGQTPSWQSVGFIDDVFRHAFWPAKEFFYDLLSLPLRNVTGTKPAASLRRQMWADGLLTPRETPALNNTDSQNWLSQFRVLRPETKDLISRYVKPDSLYISYEGSPALLGYLDELGITYIDIRLSPIRFLPDVLPALRSNSAQINAKLDDLAISQQDIVREANLLAASFRHQDRYTPDPKISRNRGVQMVVVGQTADDASIISGDGFFRLHDAVAILGEKLRGRHIVYLRHPGAPEEHAQSEISLLSTFSPNVEVSTANSYDLLCCDEPMEFVGISSGLMQETPFFGKPSHSLLPHICPVSYAEENARDDKGYRQILFDTLIDEDFWRLIFGQTTHRDRDTLRNMPANRLRELHNVWWGYAAHKVKPNDFNRGFTREVEEQVDRVHGTTKFILDMIAGQQDFAGHNEISARRWRWISGGVITMEASGDVLRDGRKEGVWRRMASNPNVAFVLWDNGSWIDFVSYQNDGTLQCRNNRGETFTIRAA